ncbi:MAG: DUF5916 domain-containing protein [Bacteroidetes bacterium]|nr:DUF5916 domain-containing protein [Bacteroidota bacterium]
MSHRYFILLFLLILPLFIFAGNDKKRVDAIRIKTPIQIDGELKEEAWKNAPVASDFIEYSPYNGHPSLFRTEVRFLYDNTGLYIGAKMFDPTPDSIPMQTGLRDPDDLNADDFGILISPFNDGINAFGFVLYSSDVQADLKIPSVSTNNNGNDYTWNAVWQSKAKITKDGWVAEFRIPYSAIRFPKTSVQEWGINCYRDIRRFRERSTWNFINVKTDGEANQEGLLTGIRDIVPPIRLSLSPYLSGYLEKSPDTRTWELSYNYGADLKYGINQSFTLDMTLIPDFGQVPSDDKVYNFSPFEIQYDEKRQFFTEGTELFNKSGIFYSRRIGSQPKAYESVNDALGSNEKVVDNPMQVKLVNASKISGRTTHGLGIGFFNAMASNTLATIRDTVTGNRRKFLTQGFTNYNMIVFDQALKNNSYFDLLNTNYYLPTEGYTANVSGIQFRIANKKYTWAFGGNAFVSQKYHSHAKPDLGYHYSLSYGKISGNFLFNYNQVVETDRYDPNDMGFNESNNKFNNILTFNYNIYQPFGKFLSFYNYLRIAYNCLYNGVKYASIPIDFQSHLTTRKHLDIGLNSSILPLPYHDYFEPRVAGRMYIQPAEYNIVFWISPDYRKKFIVDATAVYYWASRNHSNGYHLELSLRYRISDKFTINYMASLELIRNNTGYVLDSMDNNNNHVIIFGKRDIQTIINMFHANYMFNSNMSLDLRLRHYWVKTPYSTFYTLRNDGNLDPYNYKGNQDINCNIFTIEFNYTWIFAPGSELSLMWKQSVNKISNVIEHNFFNNLDQTLGSPATNSFSIKVLYYLDALYFRKKQPRQ